MSTLISSTVVADAYKNKEAIANSANINSFFGANGGVIDPGSHWQNLALSKKQEETFWNRDTTGLSLDQLSSQLGKNSIDDLVNSGELKQLINAIDVASKDDPMAKYGLMIAAEKTIEHLRSQPLENTEFKTEEDRTLAAMKELADKINSGEFQRYPAVNAEQLTSMNAIVHDALRYDPQQDSTKNAQHLAPMDVMHSFHSYAAATNNKQLEKITESYVDIFQHFSINPSKANVATQLDLISDQMATVLTNSQDQQSKIQQAPDYYPTASQDQQTGMAA